MGLQYQQDAFLKDELSQYVPINAQARNELQQLDQLFHIDDLDPFYATRRLIHSFITNYSFQINFIQSFSDMISNEPDILSLEVLLMMKMY